MKKCLTRLTGAALAVMMAVPTMPVLAASANSGTITATFGVYAPSLTVTVPVSTAIKINPAADSNATTKVEGYTVASDNIVILNATVDEKGNPLKVLFTVNAKYTGVAEDVVAHYGTFSKNDLSKSKELQLKMVPSSSVTLGTAGSGTSIDLTQATVTLNTSSAQVVTSLGSQLNLQVGAPTLGSNEEFTAFGTAAFALIGDANTNADWENDDVAVELTYNMKASSVDVAKFVISGAVATAPTTTEITVSDASTVNLNGATIKSVMVANPDGEYPEYVFPESNYTVEYTAATTPDDAKYKITLNADDPGVAFIKDAYSGKAQDLVILMSDGRVIITTITLTK